MTKVAIKIEAKSPEVAPIKGDTGGSLRSIASSCPASPPINEATMACQKPSPCGSNSWKVDPNTARRTSNAIATATNAVTMASHTWFVNTLANTRPTSAPLNAPVRTIARTLAETEPSIRAILFRAFFACQSFLIENRRFRSDQRQRSASRSRIEPTVSGSRALFANKTDSSNSVHCLPLLAAIIRRTLEASRVRRRRPSDCASGFFGSGC